MIKTILSQAWRVYRERFGVIAAVVIVVWLPCELLSSYFETFVFGPDESSRSLKLGHLLESFIGIIATSGVTFVALKARSGQSATFPNAMGAGFQSWGRMWWTRLLCGLAIALAAVALIIPGIYLLTRLCFAETVVVAERISGRRAMARSFELTKGRFWPTFRFGLVLVLVIVLPVFLFFLPVAFIEALDHWLVYVAINLTGDVVAAFATVALLCGYEAYRCELEPESK